jgi:hypothetical protein
MIGENLPKDNNLLRGFMDAAPLGLAALQMLKVVGESKVGVDVVVRCLFSDKGSMTLTVQCSLDTWRSPDALRKLGTEVAELVTKTRGKR